MSLVQVTRCVFAITLAGAFMAGCRGPQVGSPPGTADVRQREAHGNSWMLPGASSGDLIYAVGGCGGTCVLSYPKGKLVGELTGYYGYAACSDSNGDVFISEETEVVEFAHGGTTPIATYDVPDNPPLGCSVDPESGSLAVVNGPFVAIFPAGSTNPTSYSTLIDASFCGYDNSGNLFVSGYDGQNYGLAELPNGSESFKKVSVDQSVGNPGQVQWDGKYMSYESTKPGQSTISQLSISGSSATVVGQTVLRNVRKRLTQSWIYKNSIVVPYVSHGPTATNIGIWKYPKGGRPTKRISEFGGTKPSGFAGVTISVAR